MHEEYINNYRCKSDYKDRLWILNSLGKDVYINGIRMTDLCYNIVGNQYIDINAEAGLYLGKLTAVARVGSNNIGDPYVYYYVFDPNRRGSQQEKLIYIYNNSGTATIREEER